MQEINDRHEVYKIFSSPCTKCKNRFESVTFVCAAFPEGIPDEILSGEDLHTKTRRGQKNDLIFERRENNLSGKLVTKIHNFAFMNLPSLFVL